MSTDGKDVRNEWPGEKPAPTVPPEIREALTVTWKLKGYLKNAQIAYIRVGVLLARVRDQELFKRLKHETIEDYAVDRVRLGRSSLYKYLQIHDWIKEHHKEWLEPKPKGYIPDLTDAGDLMWIENELEKQNLDPKKKAALEEMRDRALNGRLEHEELARWRRPRRQREETLNALLSKYRLLRKRSSELASVPREAIAHLDAAIGILENALALEKAGLHLVRGGKHTKTAAGWTRAVARPGLPQIRTCRIAASGSSGHRFAAR